MTPPEETGLLTGLLDHLWAAVTALIAVVWKMLQGTMKADRKAAAEAIEAHREETAAALATHKEEDSRRFDGLSREQETLRGYIAKVFDKLEEHGRRSEDRHLELLKTLHEGLSRKADR